MRPHSPTYLLVRHLARFAVAAAGFFVAGTLIAGMVAFQPGALIALALVGCIGFILLADEWNRWRNRDHT
jgi:membrane associated rhomboid family serine protease